MGAWTGLDETVYHAVVAAPFFELGLDVLADAVANPNFDPAEVERARKLALDEIAGAAADPRRRAQPGRCSRRPSRAHGYARPVLGTGASVAALSPAALAARFAETHAGRGADRRDRGRRRRAARSPPSSARSRAIPGGSKPTASTRGKVRARMPRPSA